MFNRIFKDAKDKNVCAIMVYVNAKTAYVDSTHKTKFTPENLKEAFIKGCIVSEGDSFYKPVSVKTASNKATISYIKPNGSAPTQADIATADSATSV